MHAAVSVTSEHVSPHCSETANPDETPNFAFAIVPCPVASVAEKYRRTIDSYKAVEEREFAEGLGSVKDQMSSLTHCEATLRALASFERATSIRGALFQMVMAYDFIGVAMHHHSWARGDREPPQEVLVAKQAAYRLLYSAAQVIANTHGVPERDYAGDYHLGVDPFEFMGG